MFLLLRHEKYVIYSKLVNNPFRHTNLYTHIRYTYFFYFSVMVSLNNYYKLEELSSKSRESSGRQQQLQAIFEFFIKYNHTTQSKNQNIKNYLKRLKFVIFFYIFVLKWTLRFCLSSCTFALSRLQIVENCKKKQYKKRYFLPRWSSGTFM